MTYPPITLRITHPALPARFSRYTLPTLRSGRLGPPRHTHPLTRRRLETIHQVHPTSHMRTTNREPRLRRETTHPHAVAPPRSPPRRGRRSGSSPRRALVAVTAPPPGIALS